MRLDVLDLIAYGPFTGARLDFGHPFTIAYGPNEAGKTSTLRALLDGLFGIHPQTPDSFLHAYPNLRIGMTLSSNGGKLSFIRRKANKQALRAADDSTVVDDSLLERALHGITRDTFANMFGISHDALVKGGRALAEGQGEIGQLLFASAAGLTGLQATLARLETEAAELYTPRASSKSIHQCLRELNENEQELKKSQVVVARFQENQKALQQAAQELATSDEKIEGLRRESERLGRIREALPTISLLRQVQLNVAALMGAVLLPEDYGSRLQTAESRLQSSRQAEVEIQDELGRIAEAIAQLHIPADVLATDEAISALFQEKSAIQKSNKDCDRKVVELGELNRGLLEQAQRLRPGLSLKDAAELEPGMLARNRIQELAPQAPRLEANSDTLTRSLEDARRKLAESETTIASLPTIPDTAALAALVNRAHRILDEARGRELRSRVAAAEKSVELSLRGLSLWNGSDDDLEALPVPEAETVEDYRAAFQEAGAAEANAREKLAEANTDWDSKKSERERIVGLDAIPTLATLADARELRNLGWTAIKRVWREAAEDVAEERDFLARTGQSDLAAGYEGAVAGADDVADHIREEAERVNRVMNLDSEIARLALRCEEAQAVMDGALKNVAVLGERWAAVWSGCAIVPESPSAMLAWMRRRGAIVDQVARLREMRCDLKALGDTEAALATELSVMLALYGPVSRGGSGDLLANGETILKMAAESAERRRTALALQQSQAAEISLTEAKVAKARESMSAWRREWAAALNDAGLEPTASPASAEAYLNSVREIVAGLNKGKDLCERIAKMQADAGAFTAAVAKLVERLAPSLGGLEPEAAIVQLHRTLLAANEDYKLFQRELKRQREMQPKSIQAGQTTARHVAEMEALCREALVPDSQAARDAWAISTRRRELERQVSEYNVRLRLVSAGKTIEEFLAEATSVDADSIAGCLEDIQQQTVSAKQERVEIEAKRRNLDAEALAMQGGDLAASAAQRVSGIAGRLAGEVEQYVRLKTASFVLRKAVERYRDRNQGPVLEAAGRLFAQLTCGSFSALRVENEDGASALVGVRSAGQTVPLAGMSDGTLDQLYLALRIASLEHYFAAHEPAPFIVDDVLLNFDDARASAALAALNTLSAKTQIIFFTHHRRLVELAETCTQATVCEL
jgi:uncharacterized protein YhaN